MHQRKVNEYTVPLQSGLHFEKCESQVLNLLVIEIKCRLVNLATYNEHPLTRWIKGVSIVLEKFPSNINTEKLRVIFLEFNTLYKIIFNSRLILVLKVREEILQEIIGSRRIQAITHLVLNKKLIADIVNAKKLSAVIAYA